MASILLKTTIPSTENDWSISRFSLLRNLLADEYEVEARDRTDNKQGDDVDLAHLGDSSFKQLWLFAVDAGDALTAADLAGIDQFRARGGGLLFTRDHFDMGRSLVRLRDIGAAHHFHSVNPEPDSERRIRDDPYTMHIEWPNYHSGANGDCLRVQPIEPIHPILRRPNKTVIEYLPAHPHEGAVSAPPALGAAARVIACGESLATRRRFNLAIAIDHYERDGTVLGRAVAEATIHRFADYNWDTTKGCPTFVDEPVGNGMQSESRALPDVQCYVRNIARWLQGYPVAPGNR